MEKGVKKYNIRNWKWKLTESINPMLSKNEISDLINKKLAYIIVKLEHSSASYVKINNFDLTCCNNGDNAV